MKKRPEYVPLELSGAGLEAFVNQLVDKLYSEFWPSGETDSKKREIINRIKSNIYSALEASQRQV